MIIKKGSVFISYRYRTRITDRFYKYLVINNVSQNYVDGSVILFDQLRKIPVKRPFVSAKINMNEYQLVHSIEMFHFVRIILLGKRKRVL